MNEDIHINPEQQRTIDEMMEKLDGLMQESHPIWIPLDEAVEFVKLVNWMCPRRDQTDWKYLNIRVDTRDNHAVVLAASDRHSEPELIPAKTIREYMNERRHPDFGGCGLTCCCRRPTPAPIPVSATETIRVLPSREASTADRSDMRSRIRDMRKRDAGGA